MTRPESPDPPDPSGAPDRDDAPERANALDRDLLRMGDEQRRHDAAASRRREQWLRRQGEDEGSLHGILTDLAESGPQLALHTRTGRVARGSVSSLGLDYLALRATTGDTTVVPLGVITSIHPEPGTSPTVGDRPHHRSSTLDVALADLAADRPVVSVHTSAGDLVQGRLWSVGRDVLVLRGEGTAMSYVPLAALNDLTIA